MKIAMIGQKRIPSREGGIEIVVEELATRMVERGHEVTCYNRKGHHISGAKYDNDVGKEYKGIRIKNVFTINKKGLAAMTSSFFAAIKAMCGNYDIVHFHAEGPAAMCWLPKLTGKRIIVTIHGLDWARAKWGGFAEKYIKWGEKQAVKYADEIIVLSRNIENYFSTTYDRSTVYIPNGVKKPIKREAKQIKALWGLEKDSYVLFLGRIVPEKGIQYLIKAWKEISTDKKLVITGGSSDTKGFFDELKQFEEENIIFTGFQQGIVLEELYSNSYIYCLPSDLEGMPLSLLEAMSYSNCCVVSDIPECKEVIEDHAVTFHRGDTVDLKSTLQKLIDNPKLVEDYRLEVADYALEKYGWEKVVSQTLELYQK